MAYSKTLRVFTRVFLVVLLASCGRDAADTVATSPSVDLFDTSSETAMSPSAGRGAATVAHQCGGLYANDRLEANQSVTSCNGIYTLVMQPDGNLVLYQYLTPIWWRGGVGPKRFAIMQPDGNLVVYNKEQYDSLPASEKNKAAVFQSHTSGYNGARLTLQNDGNLVIYFGNTPIRARFGMK